VSRQAVFVRTTRSTSQLSTCSSANTSSPAIVATPHGLAKVPGHRRHRLQRREEIDVAERLGAVEEDVVGVVHAPAPDVESRPFVLRLPIREPNYTTSDDPRHLSDRDVFVPVFSVAQLPVIYQMAVSLSVGPPED
jgi:hypothetical protein